LVVSVIALSVASSGGAFAATAVTSKSKHHKAQKPSDAGQDLALLRKHAKEFRGPTGPQGSQGSPGSPGAPGPATGPAGGDLNGTYPNPTIAAGAVTPGKIGSIPTARVSSSTNQTIPNGGLGTGYTPVNFDTNVFLTGGMTHPTSGSPDTKITVPISGIYAISGGVYWSAIVNEGVRQLNIYVNGDPGTGTRVASVLDPGSEKGQNYMEITTLTKLNAGDTVELAARQTSGAPMSIYSNEEYADNETPRLEIYWVAPAS
jgi:hypothetical protein